MEQKRNLMERRLAMFELNGKRVNVQATNLDEQLGRLWISLGFPCPFWTVCDDDFCSLTNGSNSCGIGCDKPTYMTD